MRKLLHSRRFFAILIFPCLFGIFGLAYKPLDIGDHLRGWGQRLKLIEPPLPAHLIPIASPERVSTRKVLAAELQMCLRAGDYPEAARINAVLGAEGFERSYRLMKAWEGARSPTTGLIPLAVEPGFYRKFEWNTAANNLPHLLIASKYLDPQSEAGWMKTYTKAREICGDLLCAIDVDHGTIIPQDQDTRFFGTSEISKDGLLAVAERFGRGPWLDEMIHYTDALLQGAYVKTDFGNIVSNGSEKNGEMLQVLSRLYWITRDERYLEMAERTADAYLFEVIPGSGGLPVDYWDFEKHMPLKEDMRFRPAVEANSDAYPFRLNDHGGEIIPGLTEVYFLEVSLGRAKAGQYREPLQQVLDHLAACGRSPEGLFINSVETASRQPFDALPSDTWGYLLSAYQTFDLAEGSSRYADLIQQTMTAVAQQHSIEWEGQQVDGYSDTLESMLYLLPYFNLPQAAQWTDEEIEILFLKQQDNGFVENWHLDGNVIRTALMYSFYKTQGARLSPWQAGASLGAVYDRQKERLHLYASAGEAWQGKLLFDTRRSKEIWGMPQEYPRVNGEPQWFTVDRQAKYRVTDETSGAVQVYTGEELAAGLPLDLGGDQSFVRLMIEAQ